MPQIKNLTASGQQGVAFGTPGTLHLQPSRPSSFGAQGFEAAGQFGQTLDRIDQTLQNQRERLEVTTLAAEYDKRIEAVKADALKLQDPKEQQRFLEEQSEKIKGDFDPLMSSRAVQATVYSHIAQQVGRHAIDLQATSRQRAAESLLFDYGKHFNDLADKQAMLPIGQPALAVKSERHDLLFGDGGLVQAGLVTEADAKKMWEEGNDRFWQAFALQHPGKMLEIAAGHDTIEDLDVTKMPRYAQLANWKINGVNAEIKQAEAAALQRLKQAQADTQNEFIEKLTMGKLTSQEVLKSQLDPVGQGSKEHYIKLLESKAEHDARMHKAKEESFTKDPAVFLETLTKIRGGQITTEQEVEDMFARSVRKNRGITWEDTVKLRAEVDDLRTPEGLRLGQQKKTFLDGVKSRITKSSLIKTDELGDLKFAEYAAFVDEKVAEYRQQKKNVRELFDKTSSEYLGSPQAVSPYQTSMKESTQNILDKLKRKPATATQRLEKETPEEYLKRLGQ